MFQRSKKIKPNIRKSVYVLPQQSKFGVGSVNYLNLLLTSLRKDPTNILEKKDFGNNQFTLTPLKKKNRKLEQYLHHHDHESGKSSYSVSYLLPTEATDQTSYLEIKLRRPIKVETTHFTNQTGDAYLVIEEMLGKGSFASVKSGNLVYWFDNSDQLHSEFISPIARKTFKPRNLMIKMGLNRARIEDLINLEFKVGKAYFNDPLELHHYKKMDGSDRFDISMPKLPMTLKKFLAEGSVGKLTYAQRFYLLQNLAAEIHKFHLKTHFIHHDLKPDNIAINPQTLHSTLFDFGLANEIGQPWPRGGSELYCDPKLLNLEQIQSSETNDFYAFGLICVLVLIATNKDLRDIYTFVEASLISKTRENLKTDFLEKKLNEMNYQHVDEIKKFLHDLLLNGCKLNYFQIQKKLTIFYKEYLDEENINLSQQEQYVRAKTQLLRTCDNANICSEYRDSARMVLQQSDRLVKNKDERILPKLTLALQKTKQVIENPSLKNVDDYHRYSNNFSKFPWGKVLFASMLALTGAVVTLGLLSYFAPVLLASSPILLLGISLGGSVCSQVLAGIGNVAASIGMGALSYGTHHFFARKPKPETMLHDEMDNLYRKISKNL